MAARLRLEGCQQALRRVLMLSRKTALKLLHSLICMMGWSGPLVSLVGSTSRQRALGKAGLGWDGKLLAEPQTTADSWSL